MKKTYRTPAILIVKMRYRTHLLAGTGVSSRGIELSGYEGEEGGGFSQDEN